MHPHIEKYLFQVSCQLKDLSATRRAEEVREIAQHLQALVEEGQGQGLNESQAVRTALAQFGSPQKLGRELNKAGLKRAPDHLPKSFAVMTKVMIGQAMLNLLTYGILAWPSMWSAVVRSNGGREELILLLIGFGVLYCAVSIRVGVLLRQLRRGAFWPALGLMGYQSIVYAIQFSKTFSTPHSSHSWPPISTGTVLFLPTLFCLMILVLNRKSYFRLSSAKWST